MKNLFRTLTILILLIFGVNACFAFSTGNLDKFIKKSSLNETATVAISVRNADNNEIVYQQNQKKLLHPASTLKLFSLYPALDVLGYDYFFKTQFYKDSDNNLYVKLGADPLLTSSQLKQAFQKIKDCGNSSFKNLYFDDSIIDKKEFAEGWMWDDDINPYTPKVSSYNLDGNIIKINISKAADGGVSASVKSSYPMSVVSYINSDTNSDSLDINRYNWTNPEVVEILGNVKSSKTISVPISSMRRYFIYNVEKNLQDTRINISNTSFSSKLVPKNAELITEIINPIRNIISPVLQNSNNLMAESVYKLASSVKYTATGSDALSSVMFKDFYEKNGVDSSSIIIKDGCGVSRNNLFSVDWMTLALNRLYKMKDFEQYKDNMAQSGDGTLLNRLLDLRGDVWLKTGSLSNISTIAGFVKSQDGRMYSIAVFIQNFNVNQKEVKDFENEIINIIYNR